MSWLFGSKKSKPAPQPLAADIAALEVKEDDDFILVDNDANRRSAFSDHPPMYPIIPGAASAANTSSSHSNGISQASTTPVHQLHGVPFRLSKITSLLAMTEESHQFILQRAQAAINSVDQGAFKYDFAVEKSVLKETVNY
jgi:hypothetical protein